MDFKDYVKAAIKTESVLPQSTRVDRQALQDNLDAFVLSSELLDILKKRIFYNREHDKDGQPLSVVMTRRAKELAEVAELMVDDRCAYVPGDELETDLRYVHGVIGLATEAGELVDSLYKHIGANKAVDRVNVLEEIGDVMWYIAILVDALGLDFDQILERNVAKLKARYGDKFSDEKANARDLDAERLILEALAAPPNLSGPKDGNGEEFVDDLIKSEDVGFDKWRGGMFEPQNHNNFTPQDAELIRQLMESVNHDALDEIDFLSDFQEAVKVELEFVSKASPANNVEKLALYREFYEQVRASYDLLEATRENGTNFIRSGR